MMISQNDDSEIEDVNDAPSWMNNNIGMSKIMRSFEDGFLNMKTSIIAVLWAVHPFEHIGKEVAQIERDSMDIDVLANTGSKQQCQSLLECHKRDEQQVCETTITAVRIDIRFYTTGRGIANCQSLLLYWKCHLFDYQIDMMNNANPHLGK